MTERDLVDRLAGQMNYRHAYHAGNFADVVKHAVLALILGPFMEKSLRTSLEMSAGSYAIFFTRPLCLGLLFVAAAILVVSALRLAPAEIREADAD